MDAHVTEVNEAGNASITRKVDIETPAWIVLETLAFLVGSGVLIYVYVWPHFVVALVGAASLSGFFFRLSLKPATSVVLALVYAFIAGAFVYTVSQGDWIWTGFGAFVAWAVRSDAGDHHRMLHRLGLYKRPSVD